MIKFDVIVKCDKHLEIERVLITSCSLKPLNNIVHEVLRFTSLYIWIHRLDSFFPVSLQRCM
jgi:hypothetical protein